LVARRVISFSRATASWQREHGQASAQRRVVAERGVTAHRTQAGGYAALSNDTALGGSLTVFVLP